MPLTRDFSDHMKVGTFGQETEWKYEINENISMEIGSMSNS